MTKGTRSLQHLTGFREQVRIGELTERDPVEDLERVSSRQNDDPPFFDTLYR